MAAEALTFLLAASVHRGFLLAGYQRQAAATGESVIAFVLLVALLLTWLSSPKHAAVRVVWAGIRVPGKPSWASLRSPSASAHAPSRIWRTTWPFWPCSLGDSSLRFGPCRRAITDSSFHRKAKGAAVAWTANQRCARTRPPRGTAIDIVAGSVARRYEAATLLAVRLVATGRPGVHGQSASASLGRVGNHRIAFESPAARLP